jgi:lysophospholipase L1-like esterase
MASASEPEFSLKKSLLFSGVLILSVLGGTECAVRTWAHYYREDVQTFDPETGTFVLVPGEHRTELGVVKVNSEGFVGAELEEPGPDLRRIVTVGDSCTFGAGDDEYTYPAMLGKLVDEKERPGLRYDVVNAAISGLNSELALRRLHSKVLPLQPDVVTIYVGWNDLMKLDPAGQKSDGSLAGVARLLDQSWLVKGLRKLLFFHVRPHVSPPRTGLDSSSGEFEGFRSPIFEANLKAMIDASAEAGGRVAVMTLPTVVRLDMALEQLRQSNVVFPYFSSAYGVGDLLDLIAAYNGSIRRVASESGVPIVDLERLFAEIEDPQPLFWDTMHPNPQGMELIARETLSVLERSGFIGGASPRLSGDG